ncbi:MAG: oligosaccharide flippase family protein, partial [Chloroflexota bacterium]
MSSGSDYNEPGPGHEFESLVAPPQEPPGPAPGRLDDQVERRGLRAAGQLVARTVVTRGITLVGTVALARILSPADFGVFAIITLIVTILTVVGDLGIGAGLVQQREEPTTADLETVLAVQLALFGGLGLAAAVVGPALALVLDLGPGSAELALLLALTILTIPVRGVPIALLSRSLRFGPLAASEVIQQIAFFGVAVGCAASGVGVVSFGFAAAAQSIVATLVAWAVWRRKPPRPRFDRAVAARL